MSQPDSYTHYMPIIEVSTYNESSARAESATLLLTVKAGVAAPIRLEIVGLGDVVFTREQSAELRAQLKRAEIDLRTGALPATVATGTEGLCESCSRPIRAGELVVVDDQPGDRVVVHTAPCVEFPR